MPRKLDPQTKQDRAELRERKTQRRQLVNTHKAAQKAHTRALTDLETRIAVITGRLTK